MSPFDRARRASANRQRRGAGSDGNPIGEHRLQSRRDVLVGARATLAISLAGCMGPGGGGGVGQGGAKLPPATLRMEPVADPELPARVLYSIGTEDGPDRRVDLIDDILEGGATVERTGPPLPEDQHIYYDGAVYVLTHEIIEETPATSYQIRVDIVQGTVVDSEAVNFSDLPAVDREKFAAYGWDEGGSFGFGTAILYTHTEREKSALVPTSKYSYIVWEDGSEAAWFVDDSHETTLNTYEYSAERHSTAAEYGRRIRNQLTFELTRLSEAETAIVRTAIDEDEYAVNHDQTPTAAFWSLTDQFRPQEQAHGLDEDGGGDLSGSYLVRYDDEVYWTVLLVNVERTGTQTAG